MATTVRGATESRQATTSDPPDDPPGSSARWIGFAVTSLALLMSSIDSTAVATALSTIQTDLATTLVWVGWTITIYSVGLILASPVAARLADRYGARRVFLSAVALFAAASLLCALCRSIEPLIVLRFLQGLAGGLLIPTATGIVSHHFGQDRDRAIALFSSIFPIGAIAGPLVGGTIVSLWSWQGIFLVNVPIGIVLVVAGLLVIGEVPRRPGGHFDLWGTAIITVLLISGMFAIAKVEGLGQGWVPTLEFVVAAAVTVGGGWLYVRHARDDPDAVVPLQLLRGPQLGTVNLMNLLYGAAVLGFSALIPHYAQLRYGIQPLASGALLSARAVVMVVASLAAVALLRRLGHKPLLLVGMGAVIVGLVTTALPPVGMSADVWLTLSAAVLGFGTGLAAPSSNNMGMHLMPDDAAALSALRRTFRQTGSIIAVSLTTAVTSASAHPAEASAVAFLALATIMTAGTLVAARVPNQRGRW